MSANETKLIIDERLAKPSSVTPTLFIGLGGCGLRIVERVKKHLQEHPDYNERYKDLNKFVAFDTNINDLENAREHMDDTFLLSDFEKEDYARLANGQLFLEPDSYFTQWVPENYRFRAGDTAGAGQIRIESRLGLYYQLKHRDVIKRLRNVLEKLKDHAHGHRRLDTNELRIVLCYSVAGGTGSGAHLPMAYLIRDLAAQLGKPRLYAVSVLPSVFEDKTGRNKDGIFANGYAALKEAEHLMKLGAPEALNYPQDGIPFHYNPADTTKKSVRQQPFDFIYVIDRPEKFSVSDVVKAAADGLYLQLFSPIFKEQAGDYDNYTQHQRFLVPHDFEKKGVKGFTSFYGSFGSAVLLVPTQGLLNYCSKAVALNTLRSSFVTQVPAGSQFDRIRATLDDFNTAKFESSDGELQNITADELNQLSDTDKTSARRALFTKRVRLLARSEYERRQDLAKREYLEIWRHGHGASFLAPSMDAGEHGERATVNNPNAKGANTDKFEHSIVGAMELSIGEWTNGAVDTSKMKLLQAAHTQLQNAAAEIISQQVTDNAVRERPETIFNNVVEEIRIAYNSALRKMTERTDELKGLNYLKNLEFLTDIQAGIDLRKQRYAFSQLVKHPSFTWAKNASRRQDREPLPPPPDLASNDVKSRMPFSSPTVDESAVNGNLETLKTSSNDVAQYHIDALTAKFAEGLVAMHERFESYEAQLAGMESNFEQIERRISRELEQMVQNGGTQANQFILDGEALQMENGHRLWEYYYEERHAGRTDFSFQNHIINEITSRRLMDLAREKSTRKNTGRNILQEVIDDIESYAHSVLQPELEGVPGHVDAARRNGYTLEEALSDEIRFRALHLSHNTASDKNKAGGHDARQAIRRELGRLAAMPEEERRSISSLDNPSNRDYIRDKIKRIVHERAQPLCYYDDSRDQQGGVRPCRVGLGTMHSELRATEIGKLLCSKELAGDIQWLDDPANGMRQVVFYRAVLNVPLYVFGRMKEMQADYHAFRNMSKRPKVLHIDKNWENTLQDLDPEAAIDFHRRENLRRQIIGFATLLTVHRALGDGHKPLITQLPGQGSADESYWILRPVSGPGGGLASAPVTEFVTESEVRDGYQRLGRDLRESIANLPEVLQNNAIAYQPYQALINGVRDGLSPLVIDEICKQVLSWRQQHDSRRERFGGMPDEHQTARLNDLKEAWTRLAEAIEDLYKKLSDVRDEQASSSSANWNESYSAETRNNTAALEDSVNTLQNFRQQWHAINHPEEASRTNDIFGALFGPLKGNKAR